MSLVGNLGNDWIAVALRLWLPGLLHVKRSQLKSKRFEPLNPRYFNPNDFEWTHRTHPVKHPGAGHKDASLAKR